MIRGHSTRRNRENPPLEDLATATFESICMKLYDRDLPFTGNDNGPKFNKEGVNSTTAGLDDTTVLDLCILHMIDIKLHINYFSCTLHVLTPKRIIIILSRMNYPLNVPKGSGPNLLSNE